MSNRATIVNTLGEPPKLKQSATGLFSSDWLLQFTNRLQTALGPEQLLDIFNDEIKRVVEIESVAFHHGSSGLTVVIGEQQGNSASYELILSDENLGKIIFYRNGAFQEMDRNQLEALVSHLLYPLRNSLLYRQALLAASRDPLTDTFNRTALDSTLTREICLAHRHKNPLAILMLDLDHFKTVNDQYGHITGDCVLRAFVEKVAHEIRLSDILFRYGGEEFTVLLRNTDPQGAELLAERIRHGVEKLSITCDSVPVKITVSIGVANLVADEAPEGLLNRADLALYQSKENSRNRVTSSQP